MSPINDQKELAKPCLNGLQALVADQKMVEWLVVANDDAAMVGCIANVVDSDAAVILQIPQFEWDFAESDLSEAIAWTISQKKLQHLLLVGHSEGLDVPVEPGWTGDGFRTDDPSDSTRDSYKRLMESVNLSNQRIHLAKQDFASRVRDLLDVPELHRAVGAKRLQLHALFYIANCGNFQIFDVHSGQFIPLPS